MKLDQESATSHFTTTLAVAVESCCTVQMPPVTPTSNAPGTSSSLVTPLPSSPTARATRIPSMNSVPNLAPHELVVPTSRSPVKHTLIPGEHPTSSIASAEAGAQALTEVLSRTASSTAGVKESRYK